MNARTISCILAALLLPLPAAAAELPDAIAAPGEALVATLHAQGEQVYECALDRSRKLAWRFLEPVATLLMEGKTVGRHYGGPNWELSDGSGVVAKVSGSASGETAADIPLLKLEVVSRRGTDGLLSEVATIQRLNTKGGVAQGTCDEAGRLLSVPYSADYAFYKKMRVSLPPDAPQAQAR